MLFLTVKILATGLGTGLSKVAPGTVGSLAAIGIWWLLNQKFLIPPQLLALLSIILSLLIVEAYLRLSPSNTTKDPQEVVIDEWAGIFCTLSFCSSPTVTDLIAAFVYFRLFDITKPGIIKKLEKLKGSWGIVADDIAAGILAAFCLHATKFVGLQAGL